MFRIAGSEGDLRLAREDPEVTFGVRARDNAVKHLQQRALQRSGVGR